MTAQRGGAERFEAVWSDVERVEGWLTRSQAARLFDAARLVPTGAVIVEVGSHRGKSTILLARAKPPGVELAAVDPFTDPTWGGGRESLEVWQRNLCAHGVEREVRLVRRTSVEAAREWEGNRVALLYVDGAHDYESVLADLDAWRPHLQPGALVFLHDAFSSPGVTAALLRRLLFNRRFDYLGSERTLAGFQMTDVTYMSAAGTSARLLFRLPYLVRNLLVKLALRRDWSWLNVLLGHRTREMPY